MITKEVTVTNNAGFHVRCSSLVAQSAVKYQSDIVMDRNGKRADCKSTLDMLTLMCPKDAKLVIMASGSDEEQAISEIVSLFEHKFYEDEFAPTQSSNPTTES